MAAKRERRATAQAQIVVTLIEGDTKTQYGAETYNLQFGVYCEDCEWTSTDPTDAVTNYECSSCGNTFTADESPNGNHQCECGKFASRAEETACPECSGTVAEEWLIECPLCQEDVALSGFTQHLTDNCGK